MAPLESILGNDSPSNVTTECHEFYCFSTVKTGQNLLTGLGLDLILGGLCLFGFIVWRRTFPIYQARLYNSDARFRPTELRVDGHRRIWSWLVPVFKVTDRELLRQGGLDALASLRILEYGFLLMIPMTILGVGILLPVNYTAHGVNQTIDNLTSAFLSMTLSNIPRESGLLWVSFVYLLVFVGVASYLLIRFHKSHLSLATWYQYYSGLSTTNPSLAASEGKVLALLEAPGTPPGVPPSAALGSVSPFERFQREHDEAQRTLDRQLAQISARPTTDVELTRASGGGGAKASVADGASSPGASRAEPLSNASAKGIDQGPIELEAIKLDNGPNDSAAAQLPEEVLATADSAPRPSAKAAAEASRGLTRLQAWRAVQDRQIQVLSVHGEPCPLPHPGRHAVLILDDAARRYRFSLHGVLPGVSALARKRAFWPGSASLQDAEDAESARWMADPALARSMGRPTSEEEADAHREMVAAAAGGADGRKPVDYFFDAERSPEDGEDPGGLDSEDSDTDEQTALGVQGAREGGKGGPSAFERAPSKRWRWIAPSPTLRTLRRWRRANRRMRAVGRIYSDVFGEDFLGLVPVFDCRSVDKLMSRRWWQQCRLERAQYDLIEVSARLARAEAAPGSRSWWAARRERGLRRRQARLEIAIAATEADLEDLERDIRDERDRALSRPPCGPFFALFRTQTAAAFATGVDVNPPDRRLMHAVPSPEPDDINWAALLKGWRQRLVRPLLVLPLIAAIMVFPIGIFTGAFSQLSTAICNSESASKSWFCSDAWWAKFCRNLLTGFLPSLLLTLYQSLALPIAFYIIGQAEGVNYSLSELDARTGSWFFYWNVFNMFLGALLGGSIFSAIRGFIQDPSSIWKLLGSAIPASSNFFVNYVMFRAFAMTFFRLFWPCAAVLPFILKWLRLLRWGRTPMDVAAEVPARNLRHSRDVSAIVMAIYIAVTAYAPITPFILPFGLIYFALTWIVWRYQILYVFNSSPSGHGQVWNYFARRMVACLLIQAIFFAAMMIVKAAYAQAITTLVVVPIWLLALNRYLATLAANPSTLRLNSWHVEKAWQAKPELFVAPPLRPDADKIWFPEWGKAWQYWSVPRYGI